MNPKHYFTAIFIFAAIFFAGCAPSMHVIYSFNNISTPNSVETIPISVDVKTLKDSRAELEENKLLFNNYPKQFIEGKTYCINAEKYYNKEGVANQITQLLVKHFNHAKLFATASYNENHNSDYYLTGTLSRFYGEQNISARTAAGGTNEAVGGAIVGGILFGAIGGAIGGAIAGSAMEGKAPAKIIIEISDLKLFRKDDTLIKDFGNFCKKYEGAFPANEDCRYIYQNINAILRDFNTELIETMRAELLEINFKERY